MKMNIAGKLIGLLAACAVMVPMQQVSAAEGVQVGVLQCTVVPGSRLNLLIRSTADVTCTYDNNGTVEHYKGDTGIALGLDLSFKTNEKMAFAVIAASADTAPGAYALAGKYVGGEANAAAGVGVGAKVLIGGGDKNISLQPIAVESHEGIGASGGLSFLYIEPVK